MIKFLILTFIPFCFFASSLDSASSPKRTVELVSQREESCRLKLAELPTLRSFRLGMTLREIFRAHPKLISRGHLNKSDPNGFLEIVFEQNSSLDEYLPEIDRKGLSVIRLAFLDDQLAKLHLIYDGFTEWGDVSEFLIAITSTLKLPAPVNWKEVDSKTRRLDCDQVMVEVRLEPRVGAYDLEQPSLTLAKSGLQAELENREKGKKERQRKIFKP